MKQRISLIFGSRPEAVKLCPLIRLLRRHPRIEPHVCVTAQHRQMLDQTLRVFGVKPDVDLDLMRPNQTLADFAARALQAVDRYLAEYRPKLVLVQGDTTTVFAAALAAFYRGIPVGHVEAGLRTWNKLAPFPEEINRTLVTRLSDYHFAPTAWARDNLLREGVPEDRVFLTGNPGIDALKFAVKAVRRRAALAIPGFPAKVWAALKACGKKGKNGKNEKQAGGPRLILITGHRRESFGEGFEAICQAIARLARRFPDDAFVYPVHLNPNVREPVFRILGRRRNVYLLEPLPYLEFVALMDRCHLALTDSGGIQEEAPALGKPVLVMRETTERPEAVEAGTACLVGTDAGRIVAKVTELLRNPAAYQAMARAVSPYGDGKASQRIMAICDKVIFS
ncbi:MAG: UDP-N-acetylglucosamine 2-epimerase (non-hydrolyzing) [Candidatus Sumerlaeota bacterium]|nr:UDP-N-acetylglucosamine 2-epimerase (non-hydrolyzing) [Candidatus Sumerlaeota bacterium]